MAVDGQIKANVNKTKDLRLVDDLFKIIQQKESLSGMEDTPTVNLLKRILDHLYSDICQYVSCVLNINYTNYLYAHYP